MNESPPPLKLDLRLVLESIAGTLAFVLAGIAVVELGDPYDVLLPLVVGALIVFINRILGRSSDAAIAELANQVKALVAQNGVLRTEASPSLKRQAEEAGEAIRPTGPTAPTV